ncbi:MAG: hypothetical protein DRH21_01955 [Deltaproteobacteria bacterium]|nr:MAG: hypothetical protein DRH21_01955 [Deltaproteobacteria bacterium]
MQKCQVIFYRALRPISRNAILNLRSLAVAKKGTPAPDAWHILDRHRASHSNPSASFRNAKQLTDMEGATIRSEQGVTLSFSAVKYYFWTG